MKIDNKKFKLHNIQIESIDNGKVESIDDVMYLYYMITISSKKKVIEFDTYDFPQIQNLRGLYEDVEAQTPIQLNNTQHSVNYLLSQFGMEYNISLGKFVTNNITTYNLHFYDNFGKSVVFDYLEKEELLKLIKYVEKKLQKSYDEFNKELKLNKEEV